MYIHDLNQPTAPLQLRQLSHNTALKAGLARKVSLHMLRHFFSTHLLDQGMDVHDIQELFEYKDIKTTSIYTHVTNQTLSTIKSPLDQLKLGDHFLKKSRMIQKLCVYNELAAM